MLRTLVAIAVLVLPSCVRADEVQILHRRPSRILAFLSGKAQSSSDKQQVKEASGEQGFIPKGVRVKADDRRGLLVVTGDAGGVDSFKQMIGLIDVPSARITFDLGIACFADKYETRQQATVDNCESWTTQDSASQLKLTLTGRVNDDGTVTAVASIPTGITARSLAVRMPRSGSSLYLSVRGSSIAYCVSESTKGIPVEGWILLGTDKQIPIGRLDLDPEATYLTIRLTMQKSRAAQAEGQPEQNPPPRSGSGEGRR